MPYFTSARKTGRIAVLTILAGLACATPAAAAGGVASNPTSCTVDNVLSTPFTPWGDTADYALAPGGDFESGAAGWTLSGAAAVADGNETFAVGSGGTHSLALPAGSSAVSAPMCVDASYPFFRVFARNTGNAKAAMKVDVLFLDAKNKVQSSASGTITAGGTWQPTSQLKIGVAFAGEGAAPIAFRFTPQGKDGAWSIDDVYVDPFARR
jgi:hypothetical protein